jgi:hypothetical protein
MGVVNAMLFLGYWELDEKIAPKEAAKIVTEALEKGLWPVEGINIIGYYSSVDVPTWGVMIFEAENPEQVMKNIVALRQIKPNYFKKVRVSPAMKAEEAISILMGM